MALRFWARLFLLGGLVGLLLSAGPALLLSQAPPGWSAGFLGVLAAMLLLTVAPLATLSASAGAILWVVMLFRGARPPPPGVEPTDAREPKPQAQRPR